MLTELCIILLMCAAEPITTSHYDPGLMELQVEYRIAIGDITRAEANRHDIFVAAGPCSEIGETVYIGNDEVVWAALVVDCAGRNDPDTQEFMTFIRYELAYEDHINFGCDYMRACYLYEYEPTSPVGARGLLSP